MNVLAVTLARAGSKGVPHKHTRILGDKSVLGWTIEAVQKSELVTRYAVSSDDEAVLGIARCYGVMAIERPTELAQDDTPTLPALQHAVDFMEQFDGCRYDIIVEVRATSPFKTSSDIDNAITTLENYGADSVIGVTQLDDHHPSRAKWIDDKGYIRDFIAEPRSGRRQDCHPTAYIRNGTLYVLWRDVLMGDNPRLFGHDKSMAYIMPAERSINIDTEMDWKLCQFMITN